MYRIGIGLTASYCTIPKVLSIIESLDLSKFEIVPVASKSVINEDTRFGLGDEIKNRLEEKTSKSLITTVKAAEPFGPSNPLDCMIVMPATGNFISRFARGETNDAVTMAAKATLRNNKPVIIGVSTNDGLGLNGENIMKLMNTKNVFFIPFSQDAPQKKSNSLVSHFELIEETFTNALMNKQLQPVIREKND